MSYTAASAVIRPQPGGAEDRANSATAGGT